MWTYLEMCKSYICSYRRVGVKDLAYFITTFDVKGFSRPPDLNNMYVNEPMHVDTNRVPTS